MNLVRGAATVTSAVLAALLLAGCVADALPGPTPTPTVTPVFSSDEEALEAARTTYEGYLSAADEVLRDGGRSPERLSEWVSSAQMANEMQSATDFVESGEHLDGARTIESFELQGVADSGDGSVRVSVYVCSSIANTRLLDGSNNDVTPPDREPLVALEVGLVNTQPGEARLVVDRRDTWRGDNFCK